MIKTKWPGKVIHSVVALLVVALVLVLSSSLVPTLAAPVVASVTETAFGSDTTDHYVNMPATVNAGDLLIVLFTNDDDATVTTPSGWNLTASGYITSQVRLSVYYKIAAGTEGGTTVNFVTSDSQQAAAQVYRITDWQGTTPPEISTAATGTSAAPDPAFLDPAGWGVSNTLWLAVAGQDRGSQNGTLAYPISYTNGTSTLSSNTTQSCRIHSARRVLLTATSEDPGPFTIPVSEQWVAFTIAVRPAPRDLTISSTEGGSVTEPGEGVFPCDEGTIVDLVATPGAGSRFVEWTGDVGTIDDVNAAATTIIMNDDYSITAEFVRQYDLSINSTEGGSVTEPGENTFTYDEGEVVDLIAAADACYEFVNWTGDVGTIADVYAASTNITMDAAKNVTANFTLLSYNLTADSTDGGSVTDPGEGTFPYDCGDVVDLLATPDEVYRFDEWTGDVSTIADVNAAATNITMNGDYEITANFEQLVATTLVLLPESDTNPVDTTHNLTATVRDQFSNVMAGVAVTWNISGVGSFSGIPESPTDVDGQADAVITSSVPGTSTVRCEVTGNPSVYDTATKDWTYTPEATTLELLPETDSNPVDTTHNLTATVRDQFSNVMAGVAVTWNISGVGSFSGIPESP
ncbi:MAG: Ig-like domain-containing protein, partial [Dehalococcoidia bacterium]|nr:Ig-like domain-containing protein [Dehalococcoidia bacterium]